MVRHGKFTVSVLGLSDVTPQDYHGGGVDLFDPLPQVQMSLIDPSLLRWSLHGLSPMPLCKRQRQLEPKAPSKGTKSSNDIEPVAKFFEVACIGSPLLRIELSQDEEPDNNTNASPGHKGVFCRADVITDDLEDPFLLVQLEREEKDKLMEQIKETEAGIQEKPKDKALGAELKRLKNALDVQPKEFPSLDETVTLLDMDGLPVAQLQISMRLQWDSAIAEADEDDDPEGEKLATEDERPVLCPRPVSEALDVAEGAISASLDKAFEVWEGAVMLHKARQIAARYSLAVASAAIEMTCLNHDLGVDLVADAEVAVQSHVHSNDPRCRSLQPPPTEHTAGGTPPNSHSAEDDDRQPPSLPPSWTPDEEAVPAPIDSLARGAVPVRTTPSPARSSQVSLGDKFNLAQLPSTHLARFIKTSIVSLSPQRGLVSRVLAGSPRQPVNPRTQASDASGSTIASGIPTVLSLALLPPFGSDTLHPNPRSMSDGSASARDYSAALPAQFGPKTARPKTARPAISAEKEEARVIVKAVSPSFMTWDSPAVTALFEARSALISFLFTPKQQQQQKGEWAEGEHASDAEICLSVRSCVESVQWVGLIPEFVTVSEAIEAFQGVAGAAAGQERGQKVNKKMTLVKGDGRRRGESVDGTLEKTLGEKREKWGNLDRSKEAGGGVEGGKAGLLSLEECAQGLGRCALVGFRRGEVLGGDLSKSVDKVSALLQYLDCKLRGLAGRAVVEERDTRPLPPSRLSISKTGRPMSSPEIRSSFYDSTPPPPSLPRWWVDEAVGTPRQLRLAVGQRHGIAEDRDKSKKDNRAQSASSRNPLNPASSHSLSSSAAPSASLRPSSARGRAGSVRTAVARKLRPSSAR